MKKLVVKHNAASVLLRDFTHLRKGVLLYQQYFLNALAQFSHKK